ncbi:MAG TPA: electron transfer flavoprotein subunit beta, partial [Anaerolineae bacterium]|nr:electron transfer flavoprotein subunit beta [Anaerolineae bacterium]
MKIVVCVKQVLDPRGITVNRKAEKVFVNREEYLLDPGSKAALQVAAAIKANAPTSNGSGPVEVGALSLGPDRVDDALREAVAFGADRAMWLKDAAFDQADTF